MITEIFSTNVKRYRKVRGFSQETLAECAGLHRSYIAGIETSRRNVSLINIEKIARALCVEAKQLLESE